MSVPFTRDEFFDVFRQYNEAVWPMQWVLYASALVALAGILLRRRDSRRAVSLILAALWAWMAIAYHLVFFATINRSAIVFGGLFLIQAGLFGWLGAVGGKLRFRPRIDFAASAGVVLIGYGLVVYPLLNRFSAHPYPESPTFGLPCPTTIFTFGMLCFLERSFPRSILVVPLIWSVIGGSAAFLLGVPQDLALLVAGVASLGLLLQRQHADRWTDASRPRPVR
jgi:hypothetical protein